MAASHDPSKPNRGYFEQPRALRTLPPLPPGYDWKQQIWKYSTRDLVSKIQEEPKPMRWGKLTPSEEELSNGIKTYEYYRTGIDEFGRPRRYKSNFNQLSGVFCHRGYYDQAMKIPENSFLAIDHGLQQHSFHLYELDVKLHTNADKSLGLRKAFLSHDATGARTTADCGRWSQNDGRDVIGTMLVTRGINLEKNDFASTFQETDAQLLGLDKLLYSCDNAYSGMTGNGPAPLLDPNRYAGSTFQLDISQPGDAFAKIVAWFRYHRFANLQVIIKGYNRFYPDGPALLEAVNRSISFQSGSLLDTFRAHDEGAISVAPMHLAANSSGRRRIVTSSRDKTIRIWDYHTSMLKRTLVGHGGAVNSIACWGSVIVSGSDDTTVRIWNANTGDLKHKLRGHKGPVNAVAVASLNRELLVASASSDQKVLLWDGESGELRHILRGHKSKATSVTFFRRSETLIYVASGSSNGSILIWDARTGKLMHTLTGHSDEVTYLITFGRNLASGSVDGTARIWGTWKGSLLGTIDCHGQPVKSLAVIDDDLVILSSQTIWVWKNQTSELTPLSQYHTATITSMTVGAVREMQTIITTMSNGEVQIWAYKLLHKDRWDYEPVNESSMGIIVVFYPQPILDIALEEMGQTLKTTTPKTRLELLDYQHLKNTTMKHIKSFIDNPIPQFGPIIPEIVHCGLGLGYDTVRKTAVNPKDGSPITDPEVLLASRLDRAMIEVNVELRELHPRMVFSSCTRLSDVYLESSNAEYMADLLTGKLKPKLTGDQGIPARLRTIHGGLYPQSDFVVADDPLAEIAARTWNDEYAGLDRSQLMHMTYDDWIAQNSDVKRVVDELNSRFWPNTVERALDGARQQDDIVPAAGVPEHTQVSVQRKVRGRVTWWESYDKEGLEEMAMKARELAWGEQEEQVEKKRRWWKR